MPSVTKALLLASMAVSLAFSAPVADPKSQGFTVHQVRNENHVRNGAQALAKTYRKYGVPVPPYLAAAAKVSVSIKRAVNGTGSHGSHGSAVANPEPFDSEYLTPVNIGTPAQTLHLDFDTGSADLWVYSTELSSSEQGGHSVYNPSKSRTSKQLSDHTWDISYGDGSGASGNVYTDIVNIGGVSFRRQAVEAANKVSDQFKQDENNDGLVGLGFSNINTVSPESQKTFFDNVKGSLGSPIFAADLKHNTPGSYDFGFINSSKHTGSIAYTPVNSAKGYWQFTAANYAVGHTSYNSTVTGIADTGTTLLLLPDNIVKIYYSKVSGAQMSKSAGGWVFPCSASLPTFTFTVGTKDITIPADYLNFSPAASGPSACFGGLQSSSDIGINIFGDMALKAAYVVFDGGSTPKLGFASKSTK
ncbi:secreted aspartic proteinase precursor [Xylariaceae sp. FL0016]|nr:secreted aspartic proteinase precursor [Xylariaceae sp. FL0016]